MPYVRLEATGSGITSAGGAGSDGSGGPPETLLENYVPKIVAAYVRGRVESLSGPDAEEALAELDDLEPLEDQLEQLPSIARFQYEATVREVTSILDPLIARYNEGSAYMRNAASGGQPLPENVVAAVRLTECQLAWCVAIVGAIIGGFGSGQATLTGGMGPMSTYYMLTSGLPLDHRTAASGSAGASSGAGGGPTFGEEAFDADLCVRAFKLMAAVDSHVTAAAASVNASGGGNVPAGAIANNPMVRAFRADARLELALLYFLGNFRKAFLSEQSGMPTTAQMVAAAQQATASSAAASPSHGAINSSSGGGGAGSALVPNGTANAAADGTNKQPSLADMYAQSSGRQRTFLGLFLRMGLGDHTAVTSLALGALFNNLRFWLEREDVVTRSLDVLHDLVYSYASGRLLLSLEAISQLLNNHGPAHFPFLAVPQFSRFRTRFYASLGRLVFTEEKDDAPERLEPVLAPILSVLEQLGPATSVRSEDVMRSIIGVCRDLRGVLQAAHNRSTYVAVFEALYPAHIKTLVRCMDTWSDTPAVTNVLLKLTSELTNNRAQRIVFGSNSAAGILLFREASSMIVAYGRKMQFFTPVSACLGK